MAHSTFHNFIIWVIVFQSFLIIMFVRMYKSWENNWRCVILDSLDGSYLITLVYDIPSSKERHGDGLWLPSYFTSLFGEMSPEGGLRLQAVWT